MTPEDIPVISKTASPIELKFNDSFHNRKFFHLTVSVFVIEANAFYNHRFYFF